MKPVYAIATGLVAPLAASPAALWKAVAAGQSGVLRHEAPALSPVPFWGARLSEAQWQGITAAAPAGMLPFEQLAFAAGKAALSGRVIDPARTVLVLSTTKGAIDALGELPDARLMLHHSAALLSEALGLQTKPVVISNACVSGVTALLYGRQLLQGGRYDQVVVIGADQFSRFVLSGFQSFQAVADGRCKPFDAARAGINLGEAGACIVLSTNQEGALALLAGGSTSNDANHISGPSRTGEELALAIHRAILEARIEAADVGMISAHGTATLYNDEMEAKAFANAGLLHAPVFSAKASTGHTLGAAGVLESILVIESLRRQQLLPSNGFDTLGVSEPVRIATAAQPATLRHVLKTASGFGGCNAAAVWSRTSADS